MTAESPMRRRLRPEITATRVTVALAVLLLGLGLLPLLVRGLGLAAYVVLVGVTCLAVRRDRGVPGGWLSRRRVRRGLVALIAVDCAGLLVAPASGASPGPFLLLMLILLNVALGTSTQRVATAPDSSVDERQEAERNRAHRIAYIILAVVVGGTAVIADTVSDSSRAWLSATVSGGGAVVFLELLFVLPAMVLALIAGEPLDDDTSARRRTSRVGVALVGMTVGVPLALSLLLMVLPIGTTSASQVGPGVTQTGTPVQCRQFQAERDAGYAIGAQFRLAAQACWDGRRAVESYGMNASDCLQASYDFAVVTTTRCTQTTDPDGTLRFTWTSDVASALTPFLHRAVTMEIVIDRNGNVEQFP